MIIHNTRTKLDNSASIHFGNQETYRLFNVGKYLCSRSYQYNVVLIRLAFLAILNSHSSILWTGIFRNRHSVHMYIQTMY